MVEENFVDYRGVHFYPLEELTTDPTLFDSYFGYWRKR